MTPDIETVSCPVCGPAPNSIFWKSMGPTRYVRCNSCGLVYASPRAAHQVRYAWLDGSFTVTPELLAQLDGRKRALEIESELIRKHISRGRLLDVGCSTGDLFGFFKSPDWELYGVELVESAAQFARDQYNSDIHRGTLQTAAHADEFFDVVTIMDTFYYVDDPAAELMEVFRILRPGGYLAMEIAGQSYALWRNYGWVPRLLDGRATRANSDSSYLYWFNYRSLCLLLQKTGFEIADAQVIPSPESSNPLVNLLTALHYRSMLGLSAFQLWDWSPKWMMLAKKKEAPA
jgi:SAM-dependent methyltransferase